jgi:phytoene synthase
LWRLDVTFAAVLATGTDPMVSRIRLAWWREALERLDEAPAPPEPVLQGVQGLVMPAGIAGAELAAMEEGWAVLLAEGAPDLDRYARLRGGLLFAFSARLLGAADPRVAAAGASWALVDLARHSSRSDEAMRALEAAAARQEQRKWPHALRPLAMLTALARRDVLRGADSLERQGAPARMLRLLGVRLAGL